MMHSRVGYLAAGANRHPSTADWDISGLLAFGADRNVALWRPQVHLPFTQRLGVTGLSRNEIPFLQT